MGDRVRGGVGDGALVESIHADLLWRVLAGDDRGGAVRAGAGVVADTRAAAGARVDASGGGNAGGRQFIARAAANFRHGSGSDAVAGAGDFTRWPGAFELRFDRRMDADRVESGPVRDH